jgi:hypothetical protein
MIILNEGCSIFFATVAILKSGPPACSPRLLPSSLEQLQQGPPNKTSKTHLQVQLQKIEAQN